MFQSRISQHVPFFGLVRIVENSYESLDGVNHVVYFQAIVLQFQLRGCSFFPVTFNIRLVPGNTLFFVDEFFIAACVILERRQSVNDRLHDVVGLVFEADSKKIT